MKKNVFYMALAMSGAALLTQSCSSELDIESTSNANKATATTFTATQEGSDDVTRTSLSGTNVNWSAGDVISVFDGDSNHDFTLSSGANSTAGSFDGSVNEDVDVFYALYPFTNGAALDASNVITGINLPAEQTATINGFDPNAALMTATTTRAEKSFAFKNVCSFAKITTHLPFTEIIFKGGNSENIAGVFSATLDATGTVASKTITSGEKVITLTPTAGNVTFEAGTYYIALLPQEKLEGLSVTCVGTEKQYSKSTTKTQTGFQRNKVINLGNTSGWDEEDIPNLLPGKFSVSSTKKVHFTKSNLYWDGSSFKFEATQIDGSQTTSGTAYDPNHVSRFYWTNTTDYETGKAEYMPYSETVTFEESRLSLNDECWCGEGSPLSVEGTDKLYILTGANEGEWNYLLSGRTNAANLYKGSVTVTNGSTEAKNCLIIAPDDFTGTLKDTYTLEEVNNLGLVCLAAAGARQGNKINVGGTSCCYWSATPFDTNRWQAQYLLSSVDGTSAKSKVSALRDQFCYSIRLVRSCE